MNQPDDQLRESSAAEHGGDPLADGEMRAFEERISSALRSEAAEAAEQLQAMGAGLTGDGLTGAGLESGSAPEAIDAESIDAESIDEEAFVDSMRETWQQEAVEAHAESAEDSQGTVRRTAWLPSTGAKHTVTPIHWLADSWWAAAAAAAILAGAVGLYYSSDGDDGAPIEAEIESVTREAQYLGAEDEGNSERDNSTSPGFLPDTVDFSGSGSMEGTFRIEIYDLSRKPKLDEGDGLTFKTTIYEPRWTCPDTTRAQLPKFFRFEAYRGSDPPGAAPVYSEFFIGQ